MVFTHQLQRDRLKKDRRLIFVGLMCIFSSLYGALLTYRLLNGQADALSDIFKISVLIGASTAILAFVFWTGVMRKTETPVKGAWVGSLTALCVLPIPPFAWATKTELSYILNNQTDVSLSSISRILFVTLDALIANFSLAEALVIFMSAVLGYLVAK